MPKSKMKAETLEKVNVRGISKPIAMVDVNPGAAPTTIPANTDPSTRRKCWGCKIIAIACANRLKA